MKTLSLVGGAIALVLLLTVGLSVVLAFPVKWCWNTTMPGIFHLKEIGVLEAWCLCFLATSFFRASATANSSSKKTD
jgi:hypothetical protein